MALKSGAPARVWPLRRRIRWAVEAALALPVMALLGALPLDAASWLGGALTRAVGPWLGLHRRMDRNLARAMPELSQAERQRILKGAWENLGRTAAEYFHLEELDRSTDRITFEGQENVEVARHGANVAFSAHLANWEVAALPVVRFNERMTLIYREPNNPHIGRRIERMRESLGEDLVPKGMRAAGQILSVLRHGGRIGVLIDQKMNNGIEVPFFGRPAMTTPILAVCGLRYRCPVIPVQVVRTRGARFRVIYHPALVLPEGGVTEESTRLVTAQATAMIESWIRQHPEQWLWQHKRWKD
ncbi:lysophospholipid acyltransferase family protein [Zavarzinia sp. CC-PAN008]|uniref:lysophospholipid acyltransferase family protein n=1 Tax=Zavarzinia sp. CC-PAN008 TaxID=3243332 RepID=UPI003F744EE3